MNNSQANESEKTAFILAAGFGTRLKPFTDTLPKALVPYKGKPMIENVISKLEYFGYNKIFINTHHFHDKMEKYFSEREGNENITLIHETEILGTGGALKNVLPFLNINSHTLIYNTDVDCEVDLEKLESYFLNKSASAVLCVQERKTSRYLIFDKNKQLIGRTESGIDKLYAAYNGEYQKKAFCGIHIISNSIINDFLPENKNFDIIPQYLKLAGEQKSILYYEISDNFWKDLGIPENL